MEAPKPKTRSWWRWAGLAAALFLAVYLSAYFYGRWIPHNKATTHITAPVTADGLIDYSAAINRMLSEGVTAQNNSFVLLLQVFAPRPMDSSIGAQLADLGATSEERSISFLVERDQLLRDFRKTDPSPEQLAAEKRQLTQDEDQALGRPWDRSEFPKLAALIDGNTAALNTVAEAAERSTFYYPDGLQFGFLLDPLAGPANAMREASEQLTTRALMHVKTDPDAAIKDALTVTKLGFLVCSRPTFVDINRGYSLISSGAATFQRLAPALPMEKLAEAQAILASLPEVPTFSAAADGPERLMILAIQQAIASRRISLSPLANFLPGQHARVMQNINHNYDLLTVALNAPSLAEFDRLIGPINRRHRMIRLVQGAASTGTADDILANLHWRIGPTLHTRNRISAAQIILALEQYHRLHNHYPEDLSKLPIRVPTDALSGQPFLYQRLPDGYEIRSVGIDLTDDRTRPPTNTDQPDDLTWRMPPTED